MKGWLLVCVLLAGFCRQGIYAQLRVAPLYPLAVKKDTVKKVSSPAPPAYLSAVSPVPSRLSPDVYYQQCFGFFCKKEWMVEQRIKVPVKVRLGSYQEAQRIEGK